MLSGSEKVYKYTPVEAYGVSTYADSMISGGDGDGAVSTRGVRFFWVYDPTKPETSPSGFTGQGWFANEEHTPIKVSGYSLEHILREFELGDRTNLNDVFNTWQQYINNIPEEDHLDPIFIFQSKIGISACWKNE